MLPIATHYTQLYCKMHHHCVNTINNLFNVSDEYQIWGLYQPQAKITVLNTEYQMIEAFISRQINLECYILE